MVVTEAMLAPYRSANGTVFMERHRSRGPASTLPVHLFTSTDELFSSIWGGPVTVVEARETLEVVPVLAFIRSVPVLRRDREWLALDHQCGGYVCEHVSMIATRLEPRPSILPALNAIAREGYFAEAGRFSAADLLASRIAWYVNALRGLDLDCECTWRHLREGLYPIDATSANLERIAVNPAEVRSLADWGFEPARYDSNIAVFLLAVNSD